MKPQYNKHSLRIQYVHRVQTFLEKRVSVLYIHIHIVKKAIFLIESRDNYTKFCEIKNLKNTIRLLM